MRYQLRLTASQHARLRGHLFPGDGYEAIALLLCGRRNGQDRNVLTAHKLLPIPYERCRRTAEQVKWPTDALDAMFAEAYGREQAIVKVHSHIDVGSRTFSSLDDDSDRAVFASIHSLLADDLPHASAVMLPDGEMFGRAFTSEGNSNPLASIMVVGDDMRIWSHASPDRTDAFTLRSRQAFGNGTTDRLRGLSAAVIGCSGTGSIVVEQLARLGIGRLVLVDPDVIEAKNLNRVLNATMEDAYLRSPKVHVLASAIARMGLAQEVVPLVRNIIDREAALTVAECDVVFGCMDGVEGRHFLNRLATFYLIPYVDVGVRLDADGQGSVRSVAGAVHYLQPGRSSLLTRGVYSMAQLEAEELRRVNPALYDRHRREGYVRGIQEDRPAVISVNTLLGSMAVNEFLARLHPYRNRANADFAYVGASLCETQLYTEGEGAPDDELSRHVGRGDVVPLLDRPSLS